LVRSVRPRVATAASKAVAMRLRIKLTAEVVERLMTPGDRPLEARMRKAA
jgi:hypothetical protein